MADRKLDQFRPWILPGLLFFYVIYLLRHILIPFAAAGILSYIFKPLINWVQRRSHLPRIALVIVLYIISLVPLSFSAYQYGPSLMRDGQHFIGELPGMLDSFLKHILGEHVRIMGSEVRVDSISKEVVRRVSNALGNPAGVVNMAEYGTEAAIGIILILVLLFYFLMSPRTLPETLADTSSTEDNTRGVHSLAREIDEIIGRYLRGLLLIVLVQFATAWIGLRFIFDLPYSLPVALILGILEPIPAIGPILGFIITAGFATASGGIGLMVKVLAYIGLLRILIDNIIGPIILGWALTLHPALIILALLGGAAIFGVLGLILAIPVAACIKLLIIEWDKTGRGGNGSLDAQQKHEITASPSGE